MNCSKLPTFLMIMGYVFMTVFAVSMIWACFSFSQNADLAEAQAFEDRGYGDIERWHWKEDGGWQYTKGLDKVGLIPGVLMGAGGAGLLLTTAAAGIGAYHYSNKNEARSSDDEDKKYYEKMQHNMLKSFNGIGLSSIFVLVGFSLMAINWAIGYGTFCDKSVEKNAACIGYWALGGVTFSVLSVGSVFLGGFIPMIVMHCGQKNIKGQVRQAVTRPDEQRKSDSIILKDMINNIKTHPTINNPKESSTLRTRTHSRPAKTESEKHDSCQSVREKLETVESVEAQNDSPKETETKKRLLAKAIKDELTNGKYEQCKIRLEKTLRKMKDHTDGITQDKNELQ